MASRTVYLDPLAAVLSNGAQASASGITMPGPFAVGTPTVSSAADPGFNVAAGCDIDQFGNLYVQDVGNSKIRKFSEAGALLASFAGPGSMYGIAVDQALSRVYTSQYNGTLVRWYDYGLSGLQGSFSVPQELYTGLMVLPNGNLLIASDGAPYTLREYTNVGGLVATWYTGTAGYHPVRLRHDGTYVYVSFTNSFAASTRAVRRFRISDKADLGSHMPGTITAVAGTPNLPWTSGSKIGDYVSMVAGAVDGKLVYFMNSFETAMGGWEADPTTANFERVLVQRTGDASGFGPPYTSYLMDSVVSPSKVWATDYNGHSLRCWERRTATAQFNDLGQLLGAKAGAALLRAHVKGFDARTVKVQFRQNLGAWTDLLPSDNAALGVPMASQRVDLLVSLNTWRGFASSVIGPLDKTAPLALPAIEFDEPGPPVLYAPQLAGAAELVTG